jgi:hypothetical protein
VHLGHDEIVRQLIAAGAPLDHVNNLHWTALIESIVLGDGGAIDARSRCWSMLAPICSAPTGRPIRRFSSRVPAATPPWPTG